MYANPLLIRGGFVLCQGAIIERLHRFNHQPDSQRETPAKRVALAEVHQLCVVVFDFLEYDVLLLRQCSG